MPISVKLDLMLLERGMTLKELASAVDITPQNLSKLKNGRAVAIRVELLNRLCVVLNCQPGDLLEHVAADLNE